MQHCIAFAPRNEWADPIYSRLTLSEHLMASAMHSPSLRRVNCTEPGRGPWHVLARPERRCYLVQHRRTKSRHTVFYGTRTERTGEEAESHATALCAVLNALKAKRV